MVFSAEKYRLTLRFSLIFSLLFSLLAGGTPLLFSLPQGGPSLSVCVLSALLFALILPLLYLYFTRKFRRRRTLLREPFPETWRGILEREVRYYSSLGEKEQLRFRQEMQIFLHEKRITGVGTDVDDTCRVLVAASAVIPVFSFPDFDYDHLEEILIYPQSFTDEFDFASRDRDITGMVFSQSSAMIISKPSLYDGFRKAGGPDHVGIHEFAHKIDGEDGSIDGIPALLMDRKTSARWRILMEREMSLIEGGRSDINPYALTNRAEFFAVVSEYFFGSPEVMSRRHPELYRFLRRIFRQDTKTLYASVLRSMILPRRQK